MENAKSNKACHKARILDSLRAYCRAFSRNIGHHFTKETIQFTAMTGAAAVEIMGDTSARKYALNQKSNATVDDIDQFKDTRLNIIDEVSFAGIDDLQKLSKKMQAYTECCDKIY